MKFQNVLTNHFFMGIIKGDTALYDIIFQRKRVTQYGKNRSSIERFSACKSA